MPYDKDKAKKIKKPFKKGKMDELMDKVGGGISNIFSGMKHSERVKKMEKAAKKKKK